MDNRGYPAGLSGPEDALIEIEENTLRLETAQIRGAVKLELLCRLSLSSSSSSPPLAGLAGTRLCYRNLQASSGQTDADGYKCRSNERDAKRSVHLNPLTATTLREIYVQSRPETRYFFLGHALKTNALTTIRPEVAEVLHARRPTISMESTIGCFTSESGDGQAFRAEFQVLSERYPLPLVSSTDVLN